MPRLVTPLGSGTTLHGEQGGTGLNVQELTAGQALVVSFDSLSWSTAPFTPAGAGSLLAISTKLANYTVTTSDSTLLGNATAGDMTFTLPSAASASGYVFTFKKVDATANTVTVSGAQNIDGMASYVITTQYASMQIQSNGVTWSILNEKA